MTDLLGHPDPQPEPGAGGYRVLARTYRPSTFAELIGQDALVRTLTNAIASGRLAHAFILTGVRGVGKTTTARILARALNCTGPDGSGGPTAEPCGVCDNCKAITGDRHVDVLEMDAASRTGIGDIREIIESVRYAPVMARNKIYIIDEVHMLSTAAFNGLLKTLEEPPPHVRFIFATTEIRKVPVTVLSRCQRFDLRRVDQPVLESHFTAIAAKEGMGVEAEAIAMIARAADGSVRDGLSLLDQAIALGDGTVRAAQVREMLGLADRSRILDVFAHAMAGEAVAALDVLADLHNAGAEPLAVLHDLLEVTHALTRAKLVPAALGDRAVPEEERKRTGTLVEGLSIPVLNRAWQMLLKGIDDVQTAPAPAAALEMVVIRLIHAAGLPTPGEAVRALEGGGYGGGAGTARPAAAPTAAGPGRPVGRAAEAAPPTPPSAPMAFAAPASAPVPTPVVAVAPAPAPVAAPASFEEMVALFARNGEPLLHAHLWSGVHPVRYEPGRLEIRMKPGVPGTVPSLVMQRLSEWTERRWVVSVSSAPGQPTLKEREHAEEEAAKAEAAKHPIVRAVLDAFPGATITAVHDLRTDAEGMAAGEPAADDDEADAEGAMPADEDEMDNGWRA
ncbi:MAG: DNA polymerase III subunit gamma/tau [Rhodospirillaceae bacterium]|nr:DNA polymerase III subunit gamma/tau [Rhodospirillaceae bacterium]